MRGRTRIVEVVAGSQLAVARSLIEEYAAALPIDLGFQDFQEELARFPGEYSPPSGAVLLAYVGKEPAGVVALRRHGPSGCEMKRLYVLPRFRGRGVGRALSKKVIRKATDLGYATMRLDTLPSMDAAIALYRELGFREIPAYRYNPVAGAMFMELVLLPR